MLVAVPTFLVFAEMLIVSRCAPKVGPILFELPSFEVSSSENEVLPAPVPIVAYNILRADHSKNESKLPAEGYDFDELKCKVVNNRKLCGYNKNVGQIKNNQDIVDIGNGCRLRGDRLECGYFKVPFDGKAPPALERNQKIMRENPTTFSEGLLLNTIKASVSNAIMSTQLKKEGTKITESATTKSKRDLRESQKSFSVSSVSNNVMADATISVSLRDKNATTTSTETDKNATRTETADATDTNPVKENIESSENDDRNKTSPIDLSTTEAQPLTLNSRETELPTTTSKSVELKTTKRETRKALVTVCVEKRDRIVCYKDRFAMGQT